MRPDDHPPAGRRDALKALRAKIRDAKGPSFPLDNLIYEIVAGEGQFRRYTSDIDSALALVAEALPGWGWEVGAPVRPSGGMPWASVWPGGFGDERERHHRNAATPPLALLYALVSALSDRAPGSLALTPFLEHGSALAIASPTTGDLHEGAAETPAFETVEDASETIAAAQAASEASAALLRAVLGEEALDGEAVARRLVSAARLVMGPGETPEDGALVAALDAWLIEKG